MINFLAYSFLLPWLVISSGIRRSGRFKLVLPPVDNFEINAAIANTLLETTDSAFFTQLLDHDDPSKGTFQQKYWWNIEFWNGPGSPVILTTPGEISAANYTGYLTNRTLPGLLAQATRGAVIMIEHRYWGDSSPLDTLTTQNMRYLTLQQAIADFNYFATSVKLPFDEKNEGNADKVPWVFTGGSYSGALTAWTAGQYFVPIQQGMPKNCSKDVSIVIDYVDQVLTSGNKPEEDALKKLFGLGGLKHNDDFAAALVWGPWLWQDNSFTSDYSFFFPVCVKPGDTMVPDENGVGLDIALRGYADWFKNEFLPSFCQQFGYEDPLDISCLDTYDPTNKQFTDVTVDNAGDRQWVWMLCNEPFGYWQDGAPKSTPSMVSRLVTAEYWQRQCGMFFPTEDGFTFSSANSTVTEARTNMYTRGWSAEDIKRLIWTDGEFGPWKTSGVSSEFRPGGPLASTPQHPVQIIPGGFHCSDLVARDGHANAAVQEVIDNEIRQIVEWVEEFQHIYK